jgi:hypothetical protein
LGILSLPTDSIIRELLARSLSLSWVDAKLAHNNVSVSIIIRTTAAAVIYPRLYIMLHGFFYFFSLDCTILIIERILKRSARKRTA